MNEFKNAGAFLLRDARHAMEERIPGKCKEKQYILTKEKKQL